MIDIRKLKELVRLMVELPKTRQKNPKAKARNKKLIARLKELFATPAVAPFSISPRKLAFFGTSPLMSGSSSSSSGLSPASVHAAKVTGATARRRAAIVFMSSTCSKRRATASRHDHADFRPGHRPVV